MIDHRSPDARLRGGKGGPTGHRRSREPAAGKGARPGHGPAPRDATQAGTARSVRPPSAGSTGNPGEGADADKSSGPRAGRSRPGESGKHGATIIYGFHAVLAALGSRRRRSIAIHATTAAATRLAAEIAAAGLQPRLVSGEELTRRLGADAVHQGVLLEAGPVETIDLADIVDRSGVVLLLDQVTDPHNVGAIVRTAAAFDVDALVTTSRHTPELAGVVAKAASGGLDHLPIAEVVNLARALDELGEAGYWRVGLDSTASLDLADVALRRPLALVLGAEGKGLRHLTRERCDVLARLDMPGPIKSLNVSNACAVALTMARQRLASER